MATSEGAELPLSSPPDQEVFELSTTVDPSYVIQLIRQFLASNDTDEPPKQLSMRYDDDATGQTVSECKDSEARNTQHNEIEGSFSTEASMGLMESSAQALHGQAAACEETCIHHVASQDAHEEVKAEQPELETAEDIGGICSLGSDSNEEGNSPPGSRAVPKTAEERREEAGCMLWDLAATQAHAEFMVKNHLLDVLLAVLTTPHSDRLREVCLGILGNLACHAEPVKAIVRTPSLPNEIIQSLFVDDSPILSETCRFLSASLHSEQADSWVKAIDSQEVLERVMWIAANTMNSLLLEKPTTKSTELLLAMVDCEGSSASVLLSSLVRLGLPAVLTDLLTPEVTAFSKGTCVHGNMILDTILQIAEALSLADDAAHHLARNSKLFMLACKVIQLSGEEEVGPAAITAMVLAANLLAEREELIHEVFQDLVLIKQLVELLPTASDDPGARNACWSILGRLGSEAASYSHHSPLSTEMVLVFAQSSKVLLEDLQEHEDTKYSEELENLKGFTAKRETVDSFFHLMEAWMKLNETIETESKAYEAISSFSSLLRIWLASTEREKVLQPEENALLENGTRDIE